MQAFARSRILIAVISILSVIFATEKAIADTILYASTGDLNVNGGGRIYRIDVTLQTVTLVGNTGFSKLGGLAFDNNGVLYGVTAGGTNQLLIISPVTGVAVTVGTITGNYNNVDALRFDSTNTLYAGAFNVNIGGLLLRLDPATGSVINQLTLTGSGDAFTPGLAFSSSGTLYASRGNSAGHTEDLDSLNTTTGVLTPIGTSQAAISDICFGSDGTLYGVSPTGILYSIDPATGAKTVLFNTGVSNLAGVAALVPEPSSLLLVATTGVALFLRWLLHRRKV